MKTKVNICAEEWCNLVFEGKNKEYGAFAIRTHATQEKVKSLFITVFMAISIAAIPLLKSHHLTPPIDSGPTDPTIIKLVDMPPIPLEPETPPSFKPMRPTLKFNNPVVGINVEPEDIPTNDHMFNSKLGIGKMNIPGDENTNLKFDDDITGGAGKQKIFDICEKMPQFKGGMDELKRFLTKNLRYPEPAKVNGISGKVYIQFVVDQSGEITNVKVLRGLDNSCDQESIRVVNLMPKWNPGMQNGTPVSVYFTLPITFALGQE
jgi:protein TonB